MGLFAMILPYLVWYFAIGVVISVLVLAFYTNVMWDKNDTLLTKFMDMLLCTAAWPLVLYIMIRDLIEYVHEWSKKGGEDE